MTTAASAEDAPAPSDPRVYVEPARSYVPVVALFVVLAGGMTVDLIAGGSAHVVGWLIAIVIVVGIYFAAIRTARSMRSIIVTTAQVQVGEQSVSRELIVSVERAIDPTSPILGQRMREGLPRGAKGMSLHLVDGGVVVVPTRRPDRLTSALQVATSANAARIDIRPAEPADLRLLEDIGERADTLFRVARIELPAIPFIIEELEQAKAIFVADRPPVGFVWIDEVDGEAHIAELAVIPGMMRRGIGTRLIDAACGWARTNGYSAITLTTFAEVAWNAPYYATRGFVVDAGEPGPGLAELRHWERTVGLDAAGERVVMRRVLG